MCYLSGADQGRLAAAQQRCSQQQAQEHARFGVAAGACMVAAMGGAIFPSRCARARAHMANLDCADCGDWTTAARFA